MGANKEDSKLSAVHSTLKKRSIRIGGHPTSITLEEPFWEALKELSDAQNKPVSQLVAEIDESRGDANLSSALRVYILNSFRTKLSD